jgi:UDP-N-acetylmuramate--alanine ligase
VTKRLERIGGHVYCGHSRERVEGADVVVYSSAVPLVNPEIVEARERSIPVIPRAEMLAELMRLKYGIAIAGAHGKTTTTSMVASILSVGHLDPTVVIGGRLDIWGGSNAKLGQGDILLAEADESDGSFLALSPTVAVVTNIDYEHLDHYKDIQAIRETFVAFVNKIPFYGAAILCLDNEEIQGILPQLKKRYVTYGLTSQAEIRARDITYRGLGMRFEVLRHGASLGWVEVGIPGEHNVLNALGAIGVGLELEMDMRVIRKGLENLGGLARRFQLKGEAAGVRVLDDYGHHPNEILATLATAKACWPERRLIVVFQPHRYTRTEALFDRFCISFNEADVLLVAPIYSAGEKPMAGVTSERLAQGIRDHGHKDVHSAAVEEDLLGLLLAMVKPGDLVMTLGAGNIYQIGDMLLEDLTQRAAGDKDGRGT